MSDDDILKRLTRIETTLYGDMAARKAYDERPKNEAPQIPKPKPALVDKIQEISDILSPRIDYWRGQGLYYGIRSLVREVISERERPRRTARQRLHYRVNHLSLAMTGEPLSRWWRTRYKPTQIEEDFKGKFGSLG